MIRQFELVEKVKSYDPSANVSALNSAYVFAMKAHGAQTRESGDPYFSHPLEVAGILCDMKLDDATIITALLHDTLEDTSATYEEILKLFGKEIADLVQGVTKLTKLELESHDTKQAENFRKLVLAMSNDIRVLIVKLADRIHNMRTLHYIKSFEKRKRIARETLEIYAPLAERIGIHQFKDELSDLAFKELYFELRESIISGLKSLKFKEKSITLDDICTEIKQLFKNYPLKVNISGRIKTPYSIWQKLKRRGSSLDTLLDITGLRILVDDVSSCYQVLGVIHNAYPVIPNRFKDFISTPKSNGYQSLHTSVIGPFGQHIEIQIRTHEMHQIAEYGVAAHWQYKEHPKKRKKMDYPWLQSLLEIAEHASSPVEFFEHTKLEMFEDQVFCFTPAGKVIPLPKGSTPLDFAYAIHSDLGNKCIGAKINGKMMELTTLLNNGDQIEIISSQEKKIFSSWEKHVVTGKARANIRRSLRQQQRQQASELGRTLVRKAFHCEHQEFDTQSSLSFCEKFDVVSAEDLYIKVGEGSIPISSLLHAINPNFNNSKASDDLENSFLSQKNPPLEAIGFVKDIAPRTSIEYASCCHPLPGDKIMGVYMSPETLQVHKADCDIIQKYHADLTHECIDIMWDQLELKSFYVGILTLTINDRMKFLTTIASILSKQNANILGFRCTRQIDPFFEYRLDIEVRNTDHLENIITHLKTSSDVSSVERALN